VRENASATRPVVPNRPADSSTPVTDDLDDPLLEVAVPTVLIADDDADHRELITLALRRAGHDVVQAGDAAGVRECLGLGGIDAVVLDVRMPGESGIELCRRLRDDPATAQLPIMLVSADVNDQRIRAAQAAGADDYLTKPFHRAELTARLDNLLQRRDSPAAKAAPAALQAARYALFRAAPAPLRQTA
jgi:DNA-binding response OmpR family regulator